jgi:hypothetical protein
VIQIETEFMGKAIAEHLDEIWPKERTYYMVFWLMRDKALTHKLKHFERDLGDSEMNCSIQKVDVGIKNRKSRT